MAGIKGRSGGARQGAGPKPKTIRVPVERSYGFWYAPDKYEREFFEMACRYAGKEPTQNNVLALIEQAAKAGIDQELKRVFARYALENNAEDLVAYKQEEQ
jgi:hypothetical protein